MFSWILSVDKSLKTGNRLIVKSKSKQITWMWLCFEINWSQAVYVFSDFFSLGNSTKAVQLNQNEINYRTISELMYSRHLNSIGNFDQKMIGIPLQVPRAPVQHMVLALVLVRQMESAHRTINERNVSYHFWITLIHSLATLCSILTTNSATTSKRKLFDNILILLSTESQMIIEW